MGNRISGVRQVCHWLRDKLGYPAAVGQELVEVNYNGKLHLEVTAPHHSCTRNSRVRGWLMTSQTSIT
jgi:hypothetical protein